MRARDPQEKRRFACRDEADPMAQDDLPQVEFLAARCAIISI